MNSRTFFNNKINFPSILVKTDFCQFLIKNYFCQFCIKILLPVLIKIYNLHRTLTIFKHDFYLILNNKKFVFYCLNKIDFIRNPISISALFEIKIIFIIIFRFSLLSVWNRYFNFSFFKQYRYTKYSANSPWWIIK